MSYEDNRIQRIRAIEEDGTPAFQTDGTSSPGLASYAQVPFIEGSASWKTNEVMASPQTVQQYLYGRAPKILTVERTTLTFSMILAPTGVTASNAVAQVQSALGLLLKVVMGGETLGTGTSINTGASTTSLPCTDTMSSINALDGGALGPLTGTGGTLEAREIEAAASSTATLKLATSSTAGDGTEVHAAASYFLTQNPTTSLQFVVEGAEQDDRWLLTGCQLESLSFELPPNELPRVTFNFKGLRWYHGDDTASVLTGAAIGVATYTNFNPVYNFGELLVQDVTTSTRPTPLCYSRITFTPGWSYQEVTCPSGAEGVASWRALRAGPDSPSCGVSIVIPFEDESWYDERDGGTHQNIALQIGNTPGGTVLITAPTAQITDVQRIAENNLSYQEITFECDEDGDTTAVTDQAQSPLRIHFL